MSKYGDLRTFYLEIWWLCSNYPKSILWDLLNPFYLSCCGKNLSPKETLILTYAMDFYGNKIPNMTKFQTWKENKNHQISIRGSNQFFLFWWIFTPSWPKQIKCNSNKGFFVKTCAKAARFRAFVFFFFFEIIIFRLVGCQNIEGFLNLFSTFLSNLLPNLAKPLVDDH